MLNAPVLLPGAEVFWDAFWLLSMGRQIILGFGVVSEQPLAYADISAFARDRPWFAPGTPAFEPLVRVIRAMDRVFVECMAERRKADADAKREQQGTKRPKLILPGSDA